jgi:hypothetical protein
MATPQQIHAALVGYPRQLSWDDFRTVDRPPNDEPYDASISPSFRITRFGIAWGGSHGSYIYNPQVTVTLDPSATWAIAGARRQKALLEHEQGHLDIVGLVARDLAVKLLDMHLDKTRLQAEFNNPVAFDVRTRRINALWDVAMTEAMNRAVALMNKLQNRGIGETSLYDLDTKHGADRGGQKDWDKLLRHVKQTNANFEKTLIERDMIDSQPLSGHRATVRPAAAPVRAGL